MAIRYLHDGEYRDAHGALNYSAQQLVEAKEYRVAVAPFVALAQVCDEMGLEKDAQNHYENAVKCATSRETIDGTAKAAILRYSAFLESRREFAKAKELILIHAPNAATFDHQSNWFDLALASDLMTAEAKLEPTAIPLAQREMLYNLAKTEPSGIPSRNRLLRWKTGLLLTEGYRREGRLEDAMKVIDEVRTEIEQTKGFYWYSTAANLAKIDYLIDLNRLDEAKALMDTTEQDYLLDEPRLRSLKSSVQEHRERVDQATTL